MGLSSPKMNSESISQVIVVSPCVKEYPAVQATKTKVPFLTGNKASVFQLFPLGSPVQVSDEIIETAFSQNREND